MDTGSIIRHEPDQLPKTAAPNHIYDIARNFDPVRPILKESYRIIETVINFQDNGTVV